MGQPLPACVEAAIWRADQLGDAVADVLPSGFPGLDAALPGGGWPCGVLTEVLVSQFSIVELRLLSPALANLTQASRTVVLVGPALAPHPPGLRHGGMDERFLVWVDVDTPRDRLWATEQLVKAGSAGAIVAWLPLVHAEQQQGFSVKTWIRTPTETRPSPTVRSLRPYRTKPINTLPRSSLCGVGRPGTDGQEHDPGRRPIKFSGRDCRH